MSTTKISVSIDDADLAWLKRRARHAHGGNLSAAMTEAARLLRRHEALRAFLKSERVPQLSPKEIAEIQAEWRAPKRPTRRRRAA